MKEQAGRFKEFNIGNIRTVCVANLFKIDYGHSMSCNTIRGVSEKKREGKDYFFFLIVLLENFNYGILIDHVIAFY